MTHQASVRTRESGGSGARTLTPKVRAVLRARSGAPSIRCPVRQVGITVVRQGAQAKRCAWRVETAPFGESWVACGPRGRGSLLLASQWIDPRPSAREERCVKRGAAIRECWEASGARVFRATVKCGVDPGRMTGIHAVASSGDPRGFAEMGHAFRRTRPSLAGRPGRRRKPRPSKGDAEAADHRPSPRAAVKP